MKNMKLAQMSLLLKDLKYIIANLPGHVFWLDKNNRLIGCNRQQAQTLGFDSPEEVIGKDTYDLFPKNEADIIIQHNEDVMASGQGKSYEEIITVAGKKKVFFTQKIPLFNISGKIIGILGVGADITQPKGKEKNHLDRLAKMAQEVMGIEVNKNESPEKYAEMMRDFYEDIIAETPGNVYWMDKDCVLLGCNNNMVKLAGLNSRDDIVGKTDFDLPWKNQATRLIKNSQEVMKTGKIKVIEETAMNVDGSISTAITHKAPLKDKKGNVIGLLGISIDITERKKLEVQLKQTNEQLKETLEKLKQANEAKLSLLTIADIKLRNLLNSSFNALELLKTERLTASQKDQIEIIEKANHAMLPLMDYLLDYVSLETNALDVYKMPYDLKARCQELIKQKAARAFKNGIDDIILDYQDTVPILINCDGRRLEKILKTLLDNAIRFSNSGIITVRVEDIKREDDQATIKISVIDQGRGIGEVEQAHLFNLFSQLPIKKTADYVKAGIKLSIAKKIITIMDAEIGVQSTKGQGATFWITLTTSLLQQPLNRSNSLPWWDQYRKSVRVLLVDDNVERRTLLHQTLASSKNVAVSGDEAMKKLVQAAKAKQQFDLIVMDGELSSVKIKTLLGEINEQQSQGVLSQKVLIVEMLRPGEETALLEKLGKLGKLKKNGQQIACLFKPTIPVEFAEALKTLWGQFRTYEPYVLLVEDEKLCQRAETSMLTQLGCRVDAAETGEHAIELIKKHNYDVILIDIGLPGQSGIDVMHAVQKLKGEDTPPMIVITAHNTEDDSDAFGGAGAFDVLFKPVSVDVLKRALHEAITVYEDEMKDL